MKNACLFGISVISIGSDRSMPECNHEEADTRIVVQVLHAIQVNQAKSVLVTTVDTDVIVILIGKFHHLKAIQPVLDLWVEFVMGRNFSFISVGEVRSRSLPVFHALSGCDTTSTSMRKARSPHGRHGSCIQIDVTPTFEFLANNPFHQLILTNSSELKDAYSSHSKS